MLLLLAQTAQPEHRGGEVNLVVPDLSRVTFLSGISGPSLLMSGLLIALLGMLFGLVIYKRLRNLPVHTSMREISELIYETCKTYLQTQGKFLMFLEVFIGAAIIFYFGFLQHLEVYRVIIILIFSIIGILGSYSVAWFGIRVNTFANSRTAFASLRGKPYPCYYIPLEAGMSIGMLLISVELFMMLCILLFIPGDLAGPCFIGFAIGESLGAAALRVAGGVFTKIADIARLADFDHFGRPDVRAFTDSYSRSRRRHNPVVEAVHRDHMWNSGRCRDSGIREGVYFHRLEARSRSGHIVARRRRIAEHS